MPIIYVLLGEFGEEIRMISWLGGCFKKQFGPDDDRGSR